MASAEESRYDAKARQALIRGIDTLANAVKEVVSRASDVAGDDATTATVMAQAIYREGSKVVAAGAIGPAKGNRFAIQNTASVSGLLLTTAAMAAEKSEEKEGQRPEMPGKDMY